ncbi:hypothetical protein EDB19DRAFT_2031682 [Suillus lakei]|nr:hypothetical protein EDB19DRAFT_2031682 [Suillus lakei]
MCCVINEGGKTCLRLKGHRRGCDDTCNEVVAVTVNTYDAHGKKIKKTLHMDARRRHMLCMNCMRQHKGETYQRERACVVEGVAKESGLTVKRLKRPSVGSIQKHLASLPNNDQYRLAGVVQHPHNLEQFLSDATLPANAGCSCASGAGPQVVVLVLRQRCTCHTISHTETQSTISTWWSRTAVVLIPKTRPKSPAFTKPGTNTPSQ